MRPRIEIPPRLAELVEQRERVVVEDGAMSTIFQGRFTEPAKAGLVTTTGKVSSFKQISLYMPIFISFRSLPEPGAPKPDAADVRLGDGGEPDEHHGIRVMVGHPAFARG